MQYKNSNYIVLTILSFFAFVLLVNTSSLQAASLGDKSPYFGFKHLIDNFIKDVVSDIVDISSQAEKTVVPVAATLSTDAINKTALPATASTPMSVASVRTTNPPTTTFAGTNISHPYELIVIDNVLHIDGEVVTHKRVKELSQTGFVLHRDLLRYVPAEDVKKTAIVSKNSPSANLHQVAVKYVPPIENPVLDTKGDIFKNINTLANTAAKSSPLISASADKVVLADLYDEAIPCNYHYDNNWNNQNIHSYRYDLTKMPQTVVFLLTHGLGGDFAMPTEGAAQVTSGFGPRWGKHHNGIDLDLETGDHVKVAFDGKVRIAQYSNSFGYVVVVRHFNGLETTYAHLSKLLVSENQDVKAGSLIGLGGNTGRSRGSHLHFEVRYKGHPMNPREMIDFERNSLKNNTFVVDRSYFSSSTPYEDAHEIGGSHAATHKAAEKPHTRHAATAIKYHTVKKGDTISEIADKYNVSIQKVCSLNRVSTKTTLKPGRKLRVK